MAIKRLNYFHYQFLQEGDFKDEQAYHLSMRRRHNRDFHTYGRVRGLVVSFVAGENKVTISPGLAVDSAGREIVVEANEEVALQAFAGQTVYITIGYREDLTDPPSQPGVGGNFTRTTESFTTPQVRAAGSTWDQTLDLVLAQVTLNALPDGSVASLDFSELVEAGTKIGHADFPGLRFTVSGHGVSEWPSMRGTEESAPGTGLQGIEVDASMTAFSGNVNIAGDLTVQGVVNRADELEIADNIVRVNRYSPPTPTPLPVDAGLEVYRGGTAPSAQIIWDEAADRWRVGVAGSLDLMARMPDVAAPFDPATGHRHTGAAGDAPPVSHANLANVLGAVSTSSDATADKHVSNAQTKTWQDHVVASPANPHGTTAAMIGALPAADYGFLQSSVADLTFTEVDADTATRTIVTSFRTKFVWIVGDVSAPLGGHFFGTPLSGYADTRSAAAIVQRGNGASISRYPSAPYWNMSGTSYVNQVCGAHFQDATTTPNRIEDLGVQISQVTATAVVLTFHRSVPTTTSASVGFAGLSQLSLSLKVLCFG